jgi:hypothetical protein
MSMLLFAIAGVVVGPLTPPKPLKPESWIAYDEYPPGAFPLNKQGQIYFDVVVDKAGAVIRCEFKAAAKNEALGDQTCYAIKHNARFKAATDDQGVASYGVFHDVVNWISDPSPIYAMVPDLVVGLRGYPPGVDIHTRVAAVVEVDAGGTVSACEPEAASIPPALRDVLCDQIRRGWAPATVRDGSGTAVSYVRSITIGFEAPLVPAPN